MSGRRDREHRERDDEELSKDLYLRELRVQEFTLKKLLSMGKREKVRVLLAFLRDTGVMVNRI